MVYGNLILIIPYIDFTYHPINKTYRTCKHILINISTFAQNKYLTTNNYA